MEPASDTALLIVILIVVSILIVLFFGRLRQLKRASKEGEAESEKAPDSPRTTVESSRSSLHSRAEILNASVMVISRERGSILPFQSRPPTIAQANTDSLSIYSSQTERVSRPPTRVSIATEPRRANTPARQSRGSQPASPIYHAPPLSPRYPDSMYTTATLPSYPDTTHTSRPPPAYSDLSRTQSRRTLGEISQRMPSGESPFEAMPDLARLEAGRLQAEDARV